MFAPAAFITLLTALSGVAAVPFSQLFRTLPKDISHVAVDEAHGHYLAFKRDGSLYGRYPVDAQSNGLERRAASQCAQLSVDEAKTLPGWDAIVQYANNNWGDGSRTIVTNPSDYVDSPAQVCITDDVVELSFSGDPVCQTHTTSSEGSLVGTSGEVDIEVDQGFNTDTSYTLTTASTIGVSDTLTVKVGVPEVAEVTDALTISTEVTDTTSSTFDVSYNDVSKVTIKMTAPEGKTCTATTSTKTCNIQATGNIRYLASGWVWFNYDDETDGHYKWAASIEAVLTNQDDRSSFAEFKGSMVANTQTSYAGTCT
ncbi:uncharacterized protein BT62DRAFT_923471 [Guyanagaster necrorhizus]|uniref:Uncharacterized protein n=1 Tax=Guyanagaster necrorhizus TaxID=856835 RepID=A0A9P7VJP9_9AGAR|nr:uncharacterized protein BT62DRAFT_923471 [Guyanagaster necrorhizus MCA 3950]KAG7441251.1 hypothetical protein BT62DRAFT_923471 [Guyanagaster necrorhizus MCA 3950]